MAGILEARDGWIKDDVGSVGSGIGDGFGRAAQSTFSRGQHDETAIFTLFDESDYARARCTRCEYRAKAIESTATDFFQALCNVRDLLAKHGLIPFCYGASLNVYPSGMARDMGQGLKAYRMADGRHARTADLVEIFAVGSDVVSATVDAQEKFYRDWLASSRT